MGLLGAAVANNASWCDAVCRTHGHPGTFGARLWTSTGHRLRFYPNVITLRPEVTEPEVLAAAGHSRPFAVKDSFARLDLVPAGFRLLAEASWIAREGATASQPGDEPSDDRPTLVKVTSPGELGDWERAWADGDGGDDGRVFRPELLSDPRCAILACREQGTVTAGAIAYAADGAAGVSNVFSTGLADLTLERLCAAVPHAVAGLWPDLPVVGYEEGASLDAARQAGFHVTGKLRIWVRPAREP